MLFLEPGARAALILHAVIGAALVAAATHTVIWARRYTTGDFPRFPATRRFVTITFLLYVAQFSLGNLIYPVYKVRVRAEYFDNPAAQRAEIAARATGRDDVLHRAGREPAVTPPTAPRDLAKVARVFDVKEHWVALGLALAAGAFLLAWTWDPRRDGASPIPGRLLVVLSIGVALCAWGGALAGLYVSSFRAIGS